MTNEKVRDCEYDNYRIPAYDPSLTPDERASLETEADKQIQEALRMIAELK